MTATVLQELTDGQRAAAAKSRAIAHYGQDSEIARALVVRIDDGLTLPGFVSRSRWRALIAEVMKLEAK